MGRGTTLRLGGPRETRLCWTGRTWYHPIGQTRNRRSWKTADPRARGTPYRHSEPPRNRVSRENGRWFGSTTSNCPRKTSKLGGYLDLGFCSTGAWIGAGYKGEISWGADELAARGWGGRGRLGPVDLNEEDSRGDPGPRIEDLGAEVSSMGRERLGELLNMFTSLLPENRTRFVEPSGRYSPTNVASSSRTSHPASKSGNTPTWAPSPRSSSSISPSADWAEFDVGHILYAVLLPSPAKSDSFKEDITFLGMILDEHRTHIRPLLCFNSLSRRRVIVRALLPGPSARAEMFLAIDNEDFIVVFAEHQDAVTCLAYTFQHYFLTYYRLIRLP